MAKIILPAKMENLGKLLDFVRENATKSGLTKKDATQIIVAAEEGIINIINYAYPGGDGEVSVICEDTGDKFAIILEDQGIPFDPLSLPEPDVELPIEDRTIGGLGIFMIKNIMDNVIYEREDDWNIFTLIKNK